MSSIQERLQQKRVPLDVWNVREQLCLASAVVRSGDQNWMSVSRSLKTIGETNRPPDWYSQKSCAAQYGALLEHVETPKRKKRSSEGAVETPQESILKRLTQERITEIQSTLQEMNQQYEQLKNEVAEVRNPATTEERLKEVWAGIEAAKRAREREAARRAAWLKEREERRSRAERAWRPNQSSGATTPTTPTAPSSPLLTSLLKSSPVVTTPQHISHPANMIDTVSPSAGAPTLSMLLEKAGGVSTAHDNKQAAIEHIKNELVQIEQQLKASTTPPPAPLLPPAPIVSVPPPAVDIDDIEIKAEDVYAFREVDIPIPPVTTMHKAITRGVDKSPVKTDELHPGALMHAEAIAASLHDERVKMASLDTTPVICIEPTVEVCQPQQIEMVQEALNSGIVSEPPADVPQTERQTVNISFPDVKFPMPEIKVIQPDDQPKEGMRDPEATPSDLSFDESPDDVTSVVDESTPNVAETSETTQEFSPPVDVVTPESPVVPEQPTSAPTVPTTPKHQTPITDAIETEPGLEKEPEVTQAATVQETASQGAEDVEKTLLDVERVDNIKKDEDTEDSLPLKEMIQEEKTEDSLQQEMTADVKEEKPSEPDETHTETDDDTPMEVIREEDGKKKRDYSRKKKPESRTYSGSESAAEASAPESPFSSDSEKTYRQWKKSIMLLYSRLCAHKYASLFLRPITNDEAPGYSIIVKRPMDLTTIKKNVEAGNIRTTADFHHAILLMLNNALMYNSSEHSVYAMTREMFEEAKNQMGMFLAAQAHADFVQAETPQRRKRRHADSTSSQPSAKRPHH